MKKKVLFISSTGGHLSELLQLSPLFEKYDYNIITKKEVFMQRVIIDIGSGNIKSYIVDENKKVVPLYKKNIMFKAHFSNEKGIDEKDKEELIKGIKDIKKLSNGKPISAYATSVVPLPYLRPAIEHFMNSMIFLVSVPVLSEQITVVQPSVSTDGSFLTMQLCFTIERVPNDRHNVITAGRPSGIAATPRATATLR